MCKTETLQRKNSHRIEGATTETWADGQLGHTHTTRSPKAFCCVLCCPHQEPDRQPAQPSQHLVAGQGLENPIQTPVEMGLEQNLKQLGVTKWGAAEHGKAARPWSTWKCWSLGKKQHKGKKTNWYLGILIPRFTQLIQTYANLSLK